MAVAGPVGRATPASRAKRGVVGQPVVAFKATGAEGRATQEARVTPGQAVARGGLPAVGTTAAGARASRVAATRAVVTQRAAVIPLPAVTAVGLRPKKPA